MQPAARLALFVGVVVALWTMGRPALAMPAGVCDDRGATAIAPPPALEATDVAIRRSQALSPCEGAQALVRSTVAPTRQRSVPAWVGVDPVVATRPMPFLGSGALSVELAVSERRACPGIRWRVERPPRG